MTNNSPNLRRKLPAEVLTAAEVERLMLACGTSPTGLRNRALLALLYRGGLRCAEALGLYPHNLDAVAGTVRILHGKGDKARTVGMDPGAFAVVDAWIKVRPFGDDVPLICTDSGKPVLSCYVRALLPKLAKRAGIAKRVHAHGMRHTHACELAAEGVELRVISQQLGHSSVGTTDTYLRHLHPQAVIDAMRARNWSPKP